MFVYLDGKLAARVDKAYIASAAATPEAFGYATFNLNGSTYGTVAIDNVCSGVVKRDVPEKADYTLTFDQPKDDSVIVTSLNYANIGTAIKYADSITDANGVTKENVINIHKPYQKDPESGRSVNVTFRVKPTLVEENANYAALEFDLYAPNNGMERYLINEKDASVYTKIVLGSSVVVPKNQWVHVSIEYYPATETETLKINVTVTDNAGKTYNYSSTSTREAAPTIENLKGISISFSSAASGDYYIDNVKLTKGYKAPAES
jgi:hypothetical protein